MSDWKALVGRVTLFSAAPVSPAPSALALFKEIWAGDPDNFQRPENPLMPTVAQARRNGMSASCAVHSTRIDLSLEPSPTRPTLTARSVAMIDDTAVFYRSLNQIIDAIRKNIISGAMARVALYLNFLTISDSYVEANKALTAVIPKKFDLAITDEEDIVLQINVPQMSKKVSGIRLNALTKWSVERLQVFTVNIPAPGMPLQTFAQAPQDIQTFIAPTVVFDNSSPLERASPFDAAQQADLLTEALAIVSEMQKRIGLNLGGF